MITSIVCMIIFVVTMGFGIYYEITRNIHDFGSIITTGIVITIILSILWYSFCSVEGFYRDYRSGSQIGYITNVHKSGLIFGTMEAEMQPVAGQHVAVAEPFKFTIEDEKTFLEINKRKDLNGLVRIDYEEWFVAPYWRTESGRFLMAIKTIE